MPFFYVGVIHDGISPEDAERLLVQPMEEELRKLEGLVEFAVELHQDGKSLYDSAVEAARLRFRPIVMTSFAFILGVVPLAIATGASANSRHSIGTGVIGGMLGATAIAIFFVPMFFLVLEKLGAGRAASKTTDTDEEESGGQGAESGQGTDAEGKPAND